MAAKTLHQMSPCTLVSVPAKITWLQTEIKQRQASLSLVQTALFPQVYQRISLKCGGNFQIILHQAEFSPVSVRQSVGKFTHIQSSSVDKSDTLTYLVTDVSQ